MQRVGERVQVCVGEEWWYSTQRAEMQRLGSVWLVLLLPSFVAPQQSEEIFKFVEDYFTFKSVRIISCFTCSKRGKYIAAAMFLAFKVKADLELTLVVEHESSKLIVPKTSAGQG
jgi:hypothetical protein